MDIFRSGVDWDWNEESNLRWRGANSGIYSVKEGYNYAKEWRRARIEDQGEPSNREERNKVWKKFWNLRVPDRVKIYTWRLFYNAIPVKNNLLKRGCGEDHEGCCFCGFKVESATHIFIKCWWARAFWRSLEIERAPERVEEDIADWVWYYMSEGSVKILERVLVGVWVLWKNRNLMVHDGGGWTIETCKIKVESYLEMFGRRVLWRYPASEDPYLINQSRWTALCDGAWDGKSGKGGYAVVLIKENLIYACKIGWMERCDSEIDAEVRSIMEGLDMMQKRNIDEVDIVSDSTKAVWAVQNGLWEHGCSTREVIEGVRQMGSKQAWSIRHVFRDITMIADFLAKQARRRKWAWNREDAVPIEIATARNSSGNGQGLAWLEF